MSFSDSKNTRVLLNQIEVSQYFKSVEIADDTTEYDITGLGAQAEVMQPSAIRPANAMKLGGGYFVQTTLAPLDQIAKAGQRALLLATVCPDGYPAAGAVGALSAPAALQIAGWGQNLQAPASIKSLVGLTFDIHSQSPGVLRGQALHSPDEPDYFWRASTGYTLGTYVWPRADNGHLYQVTTAGTSAASEPTWPTSGGTVTNGGAVFTDLGALPYIDLGAAWNGNWAFGAQLLVATGTAFLGRMRLFHSANHSTWAELTHVDFNAAGAAQITGNGAVNRYLRFGADSVSGSGFNFSVLPFFDTY